jgi:esterase
MQRKYANVDGKKISYLDNEKDGQVLICLHGHFGCGSMFSFMENVHQGRLILIDQRGHGCSDRFKSYKTVDYVSDLKKIIQIEHITNPVILGHSLGGVNAYYYASENQNIKALIVEDIGTEVYCSNEFILKIPKDFNSLYEVEKAFQSINMSFDQYFIESCRYDGLKWKFLFDYNDMVISQEEMNGSHRDYWIKIVCPILLLHGKNSWACKTENIQEMAHRNKRTKLILYDNVGHTLHDECRDDFSKDVGNFLKEVSV